MQKKHILILVMIIVILLVIGWIIGYTYLTKRIDHSARSGFIKESEEWLTSDMDFAKQYGTIVSLEPESDMPVKNKQAERSEYYMDFQCTTDQETVHIRIYHTWNDGWFFRYEILASE